VTYEVPTDDFTYVSSTELRIVNPDRSDEGLSEYLSFLVDNGSGETVTYEGASGEDGVFRYLDPPAITSITRDVLGATGATGLTSGTSEDVPGLDFLTYLNGANIRSISTDTFYINEGASALNSFDGSNTSVLVSNIPIVVRGSSGSLKDTGTSSTSPLDVLVTVAGVTSTVSAVNGASGLITLASAPSTGADVLVTYYSNDQVAPVVIFGEVKAVLSAFDSEPDATQISLFYPPNSEGVYTVTLINPDKQRATTTFTYEKNEGPIVKMVSPEALRAGEVLDTIYPSDESSVTTK